MKRKSFNQFSDNLKKITMNVIPTTDRPKVKQYINTVAVTPVFLERLNQFLHSQDEDLLKMFANNEVKSEYNQQQLEYVDYFKPAERTHVDHEVCEETEENDEPSLSEEDHQTQKCEPNQLTVQQNNQKNQQKGNQAQVTQKPLQQKNIPRPIQQTEEQQLNNPVQIQQILNRYEELSLSEESGDEGIRVVHKIQLPATDTEAEIYKKNITNLMKLIPDFEASIDQDDEFTRKRKRDLITGRISGKNEWTPQQVELIRCYVKHLTDNKLRIHFGPISLVLKKPRKDCAQKYEELYLNRWSDEQKLKLCEEVRQQMRGQCYVDFNKIGAEMQKTAESCIQTYCETMDANWSEAMDERLKTYVRLSQEAPCFYSLAAYELGLYELAVQRRIKKLGLDQPVAFTADESEALREWYQRWRAEKFTTRVIEKAEVISHFPAHTVSEIKSKLEEMGCRVDRVLWK